MSWKTILKEVEVSRVLDTLMANKELFDDYFEKMIELVGLIQSNKIEEAEKAWDMLQPAVKDVEGVSHNNFHKYLDRIIND